MDLANVPLELLELILSHLTDPVSQRRLAQVSRVWRETVIRLRWLRLMSFERKLHLRLPLAGSLHELTGQEGFSLLLCVDSPVLLAGTAVFLPVRENVQHDVRGRIQLTRHGTPHQGPVGEEMISEEFSVCRAAALQWLADCGGSGRSCMQGPCKDGSGGTLGSTCRGLHPLPVMFPALQELQPGVRYQLSLSMAEEREGVAVTEQIGTVWGYQGLPRRKAGPEQNHFRWFQVFRPGLSSSVTSGQFPIIYYIA